MKAFYFLLPLLMINACKTQTETVTTTTTEKKATMGQLNQRETGCPEAGTCSVKVHKNTNLVIKEDGTGAVYPEMVAGDNMVVEYTYLKKGPEGTADGDYSETIHFEIPTAVDNLTKVNTSLSDTKLLYGKHCYCKGEAGYYPITQGELAVTKNNKTLSFNLNFEVGKTSQVVSNISEVVKL